MPRVVADRNDVLAALRALLLQHGVEGTTLTLISRATGLGKGSLYNFFPGGKEQMAFEVVKDAGAWLAQEILTPLQQSTDVAQALDRTLPAILKDAANERRLALLTALSMRRLPDRFRTRIKALFYEWAKALTRAFMRSGYSSGGAWNASEDLIAHIQGAAALGAGLDDPRAFQRMIKRLGKRFKA